MQLECNQNSQKLVEIAAHFPITQLPVNCPLLPALYPLPPALHMT